MSDVKIFQYSLKDTVEKCATLYNDGNLPLRVGVGLDGSEVVKKAMASVKRLVHVERGDTLSGLHVEDPNKSSDHPTLRPDFLQRQFDRMAYPMTRSGQKARLHWFADKKTEDRSSYQNLTHLASDHQIDVLVVGNIGHSQGKKATTEKELGHIAEYVWRDCKSNICVVKSSSYPLDQEREATWLLTTDGSHASMMAFCYVLFRLVRPQDEIIVQFFGTSEEVASDSKILMIEDYNDVLKSRGVKGRAEGIAVEAGAISQGILEQCSKVQADFLVIGLAGFTREKLGSVSSEVLSAARCSVLAVKDPLDPSKTTTEH